MGLKKSMTVRSVFMLVLGLGILTTACGTEDLSGTHELNYGGVTVEVPKKAEKILFDSVAYPVEDAMALELPVAGVAEEKGLLYGKANLYIRSAEVVDTNDTAAVEAFAPDAIVASTQANAEHIEKLSAVAPVVLSDAPEGDWRENLRMLANLSGQSSKGEKLIEQYDQDIEAFKQKWNPDGDKTAIYAYVAKNDDHFAIASFALPVLYEDLGFKSPISVESIGQTIALAPETLSSIDPDYVFVEGFWSEFPVDRREEVERLKEREGWKDLTAVQEGRVYAFEEAQVISGAMSAQSYSRMTMLKLMTEEMNR